MSDKDTTVSFQAEEDDSYVDITLPLEDWGRLAIAAHTAGKPLEDYLNDVLEAAVENPEQFRMKPQDWLTHSSHFANVTIMDPDGWDRSNYEADWARPLTLEEMRYKTERSTCMFHRPSEG